MTNAIDRIAPTAPTTQATAVEQARAVAEVAAAVQVAQQNPRDLDRAWTEMEASCARPGLASRAFYAVPNRGNGPSVHLARELARIWGNLDYGVRELRRDDVAGESEIQAFAWDQQTNVRSTRSFIVPHARMAGGSRRTLTDLGDIYLNNQNAGARAVRECVFTVLPADFVDQAKDLCAATLAAGTPEQLAAKIERAVAAYAQKGITLDQLEQKLGRARAKWNGHDFAQLDVLFSSLKRNEITVEEAFPRARVTRDEITGPQPEADEEWPATAPVPGGEGGA